METNMTMQASEIPNKFLPFLSQYGPHVIDKTAQVAVGYGYAIVGEKMGDELWQELSKYGKQVFVNPGPQGYWALITSQLTKEEAIATFGPITNIEYGPRGGWKSTTYGNVKFTDKLMKIERPK